MLATYQKYLFTQVEHINNYNLNQAHKNYDFCNKKIMTFFVQNYFHSYGQCLGLLAWKGLANKRLSPFKEKVTWLPGASTSSLSLVQ